MAVCVFVVFALFAVSMLSKPSSADDRVKVSTYYETLCPDSIAFVRNQLWPAYQAVGEIMDVDLVPYGKAAYEENSDGTVSFRCQHGSRECYGNMVQACALNQVSNITTVLSFVNCMESQRYPDRAGQKCAERNNITWADLRDCAGSSQGQQYLLALGKRTHGLNPALHFVPWININDQHSEDSQDLALANLVRLVCQTYTGPNRPDKCAPYDTTAEPNTPSADVSETTTTSS